MKKNSTTRPEENVSKPKKRKQKSAFKKAELVNADVLGPSLVFAISAAILILIGLVMIFSASSVEAINLGQHPTHYLVRQGIFLAIGLVLGYVIFLKMPFSFLQSKAIYWITIFIFALLVATLFMSKILGANRWIVIGSFSLQPSEFAKICLVIVSAKLYFEYHTYKINFTQLALGLAIIDGAFLATILFGQSDLGSTVICLVGIIAVFWLAGAPLYFIVFLLAIPVLISIFAIVLTPYRLARLFVFIDPYNDGANGLGDGYQYIRSRYALAEGGVFGLGLGNSYEKYQYLPESETDYIYAIICEELGMVGGILVAVIFIVFLVSGLMVARSCRSSFATCVSGSLVIMLSVQAFINMFCVLGMFPTTGKPLPFISYGGSSLVSSIIIVALVLSAARDSSTQDVYERRQGWFSSFKDKVTSHDGEKIARIKTINNQFVKDIDNSSRATLNSKSKSQNVAQINVREKRMSEEKTNEYNNNEHNENSRSSNRSFIDLANSLDQYKGRNR